MTILPRSMEWDATVEYGSGTPNSGKPLNRWAVDCSGTANSGKPQSAPVGGLAALLGRFALCVSCIGRLSGADCPFQSHPSAPSPPQPACGAHSLRSLRSSTRRKSKLFRALTRSLRSLARTSRAFLARATATVPRRRHGHGTATPPHKQHSHAATIHVRRRALARVPRETGPKGASRNARTA